MNPAITARWRDALAVLCAIYLVLLQSNLMNAPRSVVLGLMAVVALGLLLRPDARADAALSRPAWAVVAAYVAWAGWSAASLAWSVDPAYTAGELRADVGWTAVGALAILLSVRETVVFRRYVATILAAFAVLAAASIAMAVASTPWDDKLMHHGVGTWSTHVVLVAPLILLVRAPERAGWGNRRRPAAAAIALVALALASARATENRMVWPALLASLAVVATATAMRRPAPWRGPGLREALAFLALAALLAIAFADVAARKAESTLSPPVTIERSVAEDPRLAIWPLVGEKIAARPWAGYGYGKEILGAELAAKLGDPTLTHAHNAFASAWLQTGFVGFALFVALLAATAWRFAGYARSRDDALALAGIAGLSILAGMIVKNLTDDFFVRSNLRYLWALVALLIAFGERKIREGGRGKGEGGRGKGEGRREKGEG